MLAILAFLAITLFSAFYLSLFMCGEQSVRRLARYKHRNVATTVFVLFLVSPFVVLILYAYTILRLLGRL